MLGIDILSISTQIITATIKFHVQIRERIIHHDALSICPIYHLIVI